MPVTTAIYKGITVISGGAAGSGGQHVENQMKEIADRIGPCHKSISLPTVNNDNVDTGGLGKLFEINSRWIVTDPGSENEYVCLDNSTGAALWIPTTNSANIDASDVISGIFSSARLGTGTANSTTYLRGDLTWTTIASTPPSGSNTYVQFNDGGSFGGDSGMVFNKTTDALSILGAFSALSLTGTGLTSGRVPFVSTGGLLTDATSLTFNSGTGTLSATVFSGSGASLTSLNASNLSSGTVATARLGSGTANSSSYLRGDQTWATISGVTPGGSDTYVQFNDGGSFGGDSGMVFNKTTDALTILGAFSAASLTGTGLTTTRVPFATTGGLLTDNSVFTFTSGTGTLAATVFSGSGASLTTLNASNLSSGTVGTARLGSGSATSSTFLRGDQIWSSDGSSLTTLNASNLSSGTVGTARLGSGTANSSSFLRGDQTWATPIVVTRVSALTDGATVNTDASLGDVFTVTLGGSRTFAAPTNPIAGKKIVYQIKQGGSGSNTITWNAIFHFSGGTAPTLTTTVGSTDYVGFIYNGVDSRWDGVSERLAFS